MTAKQLNDKAEECRVIMGLMRDEASIAMMTLIIEQYERMAVESDRKVALTETVAFQRANIAAK